MVDLWNIDRFYTNLLIDPLVKQHAKLPMQNMSMYMDIRGPNSNSGLSMCMDMVEFMACPCT
jgi:hypothetical protein